ncbi:hypothetical protein F5877DRAFT_84635 [Lentinula edodes]|nr:hypothetical protein F5877DRAFT_84635 [Lentinula edodes]
MDTLSKALNALDILSLLSSLSRSDTSAPGSGSSTPGSGSSGSGGGGEDLGSDDIGDKGQSSTRLGGGSTGYSGSGAGASSGVPCGFWNNDDSTKAGDMTSCYFVVSVRTRLIFANSVSAVIRILILILDVIFVENMLAMSTSCSWLGGMVIGFARRVSP